MGDETYETAQKPTVLGKDEQQTFDAASVVTIAVSDISESCVSFSSNRFQTNEAEE